MKDHQIRELVNELRDIAVEYHGTQQLRERIARTVRPAMLQSFGNSEQLDEVGLWNNHRNTPTTKPAIDTGELLKRIEGMEVSVDISTCDADAGHRYFGTVTEISELDTAKNGYILLVQDAKPNFKQAGNSPVAQDGWINCSERMPEGSEEVLCTKEFDGPGDWRKKVGYWLAGKWTVYGASWTPTHWMPLPAAPEPDQN
ncbi:TPA: DUF551 domain-containing protein [Salmonella enterica subsp. enterica serovar Bullbay]